MPTSTRTPRCWCDAAGAPGLLGHLNDRERKIIASRFGLGGSGEKTLEQLGKELGITKERVRQIEARARDKLRTLAEPQMLDLLASDHSPRHGFPPRANPAQEYPVYPMQGIETPKGRHRVAAEYHKRVLLVVHTEEPL